REPFRLEVVASDVCQCLTHENPVERSAYTHWGPGSRSIHDPAVHRSSHDPVDIPGHLPGGIFLAGFIGVPRGHGHGRARAVGSRRVLHLELARNEPGVRPAIAPWIAWDEPRGHRQWRSVDIN